jgi:hypothetical protein
MLTFIVWMAFFVALALLASRYGVDSRPGVTTQRLDWSVRSF